MTEDFGNAEEKNKVKNSEKSQMQMDIYGRECDVELSPEKIIKTISERLKESGIAASISSGKIKAEDGKNLKNSGLFFGDIKMVYKIRKSKSGTNNEEETGTGGRILSEYVTDFCSDDYVIMPAKGGYILLNVDFQETICSDRRDDACEIFIKSEAYNPEFVFLVTGIISGVFRDKKFKYGDVSKGLGIDRPYGDTKDKFVFDPKTGSKKAIGDAGVSFMVTADMMVKKYISDSKSRENIARLNESLKNIGYINDFAKSLAVDKNSFVPENKLENLLRKSQEMYESEELVETWKAFANENAQTGGRAPDKIIKILEMKRDKDRNNLLGFLLGKGYEEIKKAVFKWVIDGIMESNGTIEEYAKDYISKTNRTILTALENGDHNFSEMGYYAKKIHFVKEYFLQDKTLGNMRITNKFKECYIYEGEEYKNRICIKLSEKILPECNELERYRDWINTERKISR